MGKRSFEVWRPSIRPYERTNLHANLYTNLLMNARLYKVELLARLATVRQAVQWTMLRSINCWGFAAYSHGELWRSG